MSKQQSEIDKLRADLSDLQGNFAALQNQYQRLHGVKDKAQADLATCVRAMNEMYQLINSNTEEDASHGYLEKFECVYHDALAKVGK